MLSVVLNRILKKIHSQDSNYEEEGTGKTHKTSRTNNEGGANQSRTSLGSAGTKTEIPDPWFS